MKRIISVILALLMIVTAFPLSAFANQDEETSTITQQEISYDSTNVLGSVVADAMNESESDKNNGYFIQNVTVTGLQASATLSAPDDTTLVIAVYDEKSGVMSTSGKTAVDSTSETVTVELAQCDIPEFFKIKAFLLNNENEPVCQNYENVEYTEAYQEFLAKTVFDFDEEKVINLDYGYESNFAVLSDDADIIAQSENENILITNDEENGIYVFENANEEITSLKENDVFYFVYGDGAEDYILTKVGSIKNNDGTVTITTADEFEISEFFSYIKIDSSKAETDAPATFAMARGFDENKGDEESETKRYEFDMFSITFKSGDKPDPDKTVVADTDVDYDITLTLKTGYMENYLKFYYDVELFGEDAYLFEYTNTTHVAFDLKIDAYGSFVLTFYAFKDAPIPILPALDLVGTIKLSIELSLHVSATGTIGLTSSNGVQRHYDKQKNIDTENKLDRPITPIIEFNGKVDVTISVTPTVSVGFKVCKVIKAQIGLSAKIDLTLTLIDAVANGDGFSINGTETTDEKYHGCELCFDVTFTATPFIFGEVTFNLTKDEKKEKLIVDINFPFIAVAPTYDYHLSLDEGKWTFEKGECENYWYKITFKVTDETNKSFENVKITAGEISKTTDIHGTAIIYLKKGSHNIKAVAPDGSTLNETIVVMKKAQTVNLQIIRCKVTVTVTDYKTGKPISNATVNGKYITDSDGVASFYLPYGDHTIIAETSDGLYKSEKITINDKAQSVNLKIFRCKVTVNVTDAEGKPIKGATVSSYTGNGTYTTNANGVASFYLGSGINSITATYEGKTVTQNIDIMKETELSVDLKFAGCKVTVTVTDVNGNTMSGVAITAVNKEYITDSNGVAVLYLSNGDYTITVNSPDGLTSKKDFVIDGENEIFISISFPLRNIKASGTCGDNLTWVFYDDGELVISGTGDMYDFSYYSKYAPWYKYRDSIKTVTINNGVTSIGRSAFEDCYSLTSITIPDSITRIGGSAFDSCDSLTNITIPNGVTNIESYTFRGCYSLTSITIPNGVTSIESSAFVGCKSLANVTLPDGITSIESSAFGGCKSLTNVTLPDSITSIGDMAFYDCESLTSIIIPDSVTSIGGGAFENCKSLKNITIPDGVTSIRNDTFEGCKSLANITLPDSITSIGDMAFYECRSLTSITIPDSVTNIGGYAFYYCTKLTSITIPDGVTEINTSTFEYCISLSSITIPVSVTSIKTGAFASCKSLKTVYYTGSEEAWNNISIGKYNYLENITKVYNYVAPQSFMLSAERTPVGLGVGDFSETVTSAVIGNEYVILVVRDKNAADLLAAENLLFIDQKTADSETLTFSFSLKDGVSDYDVLFTTNDKDDEKENVVTGDVNGDGKISAADARAALRMSAKLETYTYEQFAAADVNGDGKLTASDARIILRVSAKLQTF